MDALSLALEQKSSAAPPKSDQELVAAAKQGHEWAFAAIMRHHNQRLYRLARGILRNDADAEDVVQESYIKAFLHLDTLAESKKLSGWLARITTNEALGRLRKNNLARPREEELTADMLEREATILSPGGRAIDSPERAAARQEIRLLIEAAIDALPRDFRTVFVLRALEGLSVSDTAACLGLNEQTVKTRYHRARRDLKRSLDQQVTSALEGAFPFAGGRCDRTVAAVLGRLRTARLSDP